MNKRYVGTIGEYVSCEYLKEHYQPYICICYII